MSLEPPLPRPTPTSRPFWDALREGRIDIQRCDDCNAWVFYPRVRCNHCLSDRLTWHTVPGRGRLYTFTVARVPTAPHFAGQVPQCLGVVELDEGIRMTTTLVDCAPDDLSVGMRVEPVFDAVSDEVTMLRFRPAPGERDGR